MVLFPFWLLSSLPLLELEAVVTVVEAAVVMESVLSSEQTIAKHIYMKPFLVWTVLEVDPEMWLTNYIERHYNLILGLLVKAKKGLTNYNSSNGRSSCSISCTYSWPNGAHINIWECTDGEVSLIMPDCLTSTHQSDEKELRHSTWACNTHLYIEGITCGKL